MEIDSSVNERYRRKKNLGPLSIITFLTFLTFIWQINSTPQSKGELHLGDDPDVTKIYKNAIAEKREASSDILKIEAKLELVKQKIQSFSDEELLTIKKINLLTTLLAQADSRSARKHTKKKVLNAEKQLREIVDSQRTHKERLMNMDDQMEKAKKRLETARQVIEKIESYRKAI